MAGETGTIREGIAQSYNRQPHPRLERCQGPTKRYQYGALRRASMQETICLRNRRCWFNDSRTWAKQMADED